MKTVRDVATKAGVSVGTVSKVLSNNPTVKPALRDRVLTAVADLGYKPNMAARALRTNRLNILGLVVPDISNPFFAQLAKNIEAEAAQQAHMVMLANSDDDPDVEARQIEGLLAQMPKGLIVVGSVDQSKVSIQTEVPIVSVDRRYGDYKLISADHEAGSALVAEHLFQLGHRRIAYISGPQSTEVGRLRRKGFCDRLQQLALADATMKFQIVEGHFDYASGEDIGRRLLSERAELRPTAIAAASDQQAIGALRVARDLGIDVPTDLSIVGFDDITLANLVVPRLTSVSQNTVEIARMAVRTLLSEKPMPTEDQFVETILCARGSSGAVAIK
ncbi:LacI family transcriptional regulator [Parasedimentitalea marina]|uniref:LacI family transcriptional regulator n=1 Tax=Parasedimentitalea marina TaxID=2483033 RepID=A0A3T0N368_9RHOB|nr:LacI family DNA-binding transcriptional regulator [Parasedimentitalea marina]AZV78486.1 LacI family transcriptional regulator [Parasedimentitalea marina]